jgi:integrase
MRVGGAVRLECTAPATLTEPQMRKRQAALETLRNDLLPLGNHATIRDLMRGVALAPTVEAGALQEKLARRFAKERLQQTEPVGKPAHLVTFGEFGLKWASGKFHEEFPDHEDPPTAETIRGNLSRLAYINRSIGRIPLARLTLEDAQRAMLKENLSPRCKSRTTRRHYAQIIQTVLSRAVAPAGLITEQQYPLPRVGWLPAIATPPSHGIIYPADDAMLMRGPAPLWRRFLYGFEIREGLRLSHALRLRKRNIDFANGMITVGKGKNNPDGRTWDLNRGVAAALAALLADAKSEDFIFPQLTRDQRLDLSVLLRADLRASGVTDEMRPDLFASGDGQEPIRFQDCRQSFVALHMAMKWPESEIILRTQHVSSQVLHKNYGRKAATARVIIAKQGPLLPLDEALGMSSRTPEVSTVTSHRVGVEVGVENGSDDKSSMISSTPGRIRTYDQRIRNLPACDLASADVQTHRAEAHGRAREDISPHPVDGVVGVETGPQRGPALTLSEAALSDLLALATKAKRWDLTQAVSAQLEAIAAALPPNVASLDAARKRRDEGSGQ